MSKNVVLMEFESNPNIGIYMFANDKFCLVGKSITDSKKKEIEKILEVPVYKISILETELVGIFVTGDNDFLIIPNIEDKERQILDDICSKHDMKLVICNHRLNTIGNNICLGDKVILVNPDYPDSVVKELSKSTKYKVHKIDSVEFKAIGSVCVFANNKFFVSQEFEEAELKVILKQIGGVGTINSGSNFIASGVVCNSNGLILGSGSSTIEIQNVVESLDYL